jgi:NAD dependent epimerase/dehydratase family enzyme
MHRPSLLPTPAFGLKLLLGEMAEGLLLSGQRAMPARALETDFVFRYPRVEAALANLFGGVKGGG